MIEPLRAPALAELLDRELGGRSALDRFTRGRRARGPKVVAQILSGNLPGLAAIPDRDCHWRSVGGAGQGRDTATAYFRPSCGFDRGSATPRARRLCRGGATGAAASANARRRRSTPPIWSSPRATTLPLPSCVRAARRASSATDTRSASRSSTREVARRRSAGGSGGGGARSRRRDLGSARLSLAAALLRRGRLPARRCASRTLLAEHCDRLARRLPPGAASLAERSGGAPPSATRPSGIRSAGRAGRC